MPGERFEDRRSEITKYIHLTRRSLAQLLVLAEWITGKSDAANALSCGTFLVHAEAERVGYLFFLLRFAKCFTNLSWHVPTVSRHLRSILLYARRLIPEASGFSALWSTDGRGCFGHGNDFITIPEVLLYTWKRNLIHKRKRCITWRNYASFINTEKWICLGSCCQVIYRYER